MNGFLPRIERLPVSHIKACDQVADPSNVESRHEFSTQMAKMRDSAIKLWYCHGGKLFVEWVKKYYRRWQGDALDLERDPFVEEFLLALGNPWFDDLMAEKAAQIGFTEFCIAYTAFCASSIKIPVGFGFERARKLSDIVGPRVQRAFDHIEPIQAIRKATRKQTGRGDIDTQTRNLTIGSVLITFFYTGTDSASKAKAPVGEQREVSSNMSSFVALTIIGDEVDAWAKGSRQTAIERTSSSTLPTIPKRWGSTPGAESGLVASTVAAAKYLFEWQVDCPHCGKRQPLHPLGNFLRSVTVSDDEGHEEERFIDQTGRPFRWFCHDDSSIEQRIKTAYIGCSHCEGEIPFSQIDRPKNGGTGHYRCSKTGITLVDLHDKSVQEQQTYQIAIRMPRLASPRFNAEARIRACVESDNPLDSLQQGLGLAISLSGGGIDPKRLMECVGRPVQMKDAEVITALGVDQGQSHHWGILVRWHIPHDKDRKLRFQNAFKEVICYRKIYRISGIKDLMSEFDVDVVGIDVDPETEQATDLAEEFNPAKRKTGIVFAFNQVHLKAGKMRKTRMTVQGKEVAVYSLHRTWGLDSLRTRILRRQQSFPEGMTLDVGNDSNPFYHYVTSKRLPEGIWTKPENDPDHLMHADNFSEAALWAWLFEERKPKLAFAQIRRG